MSTCKRWTCAEDARLLSLYKANNSPGWIARAFNRSEGAIKSRLARHHFHIEHGKKCGGLEVTAEDCDHLAWIYERMANVHLENPAVDYMQRFARIISTLKTLRN